ncbi:hypothetical protein ANO11243_009790 [Dothideomycetidae sp. 11243]|nr:hypothetical protein ANO11243_009790 [fungal sp. No.11243]
MADQDSLTPRVFIFRHGETEWAKSGRFTSFTEIDLTPAGVAQVTSAAPLLVGQGKLIDPERLSRVIVSPRMRARTTMKLLFSHYLPRVCEEKVTYTEDITEWNYGDYEGLKKDEIRQLVRDKGWGKQREWDVWTERVSGRSVQQVTDRLDKLISQIKEIQRPHMRGPEPCDILLVITHGLILRCFVKRWLGFGISDHFPIMFETGAVGILSYKNNDVEQPSLHVGVPLCC